MRWLQALALATAVVILSSCGGLPSDFETLPLGEKVAAHAEHFEGGGTHLVEGRAHISWHGQEAAEAMVGFLVGREGGIPPREALMIIWPVQLRGCDLKGTTAETALQVLLKRDGLDWDLRLAAQDALDSIEDGSHLEPGQVDGLTGGPCEEALAAEADSTQSRASGVNRHEKLTPWQASRTDPPRARRLPNPAPAVEPKITFSPKNRDRGR